MPPDAIIKYFHEEPTLLEPLTPDADPDARRRADRSATSGAVPSEQSLEAFLSTPDYYRGYLAGTNRAADRVGLTTVQPPSAFTDPLVDALGATWWACASDDGAVEGLTEDEARVVLQSPAEIALLVTAEAPVAEALVAHAAEGPRRHALPALRALLREATVAFFPEPAHQGFDWSFFAKEPLRARLIAGFERHPAPGIRRFALPYQKARSESKFYFETWQLGALPDYVEEIA